MCSRAALLATSFTLNEVSIESVELSIYNLGAEAFSAKGDSGSLIWHMKKGKACIVGLEITKVAQPATMLLISPLAGTSWTRSGRSSSTPTSTAPTGQLENNIVDSLLSIFYDSFCCLGTQLSIGWFLVQTDALVVGWL